MWDRSESHTRIKLCEFETLDAAYEATRLGVDALGFHFFQHHNYQERVRRFSEIFKYLPKTVSKVLLSDLPLEKLIYACRDLPVDVIQLYSNVNIEALRNALPRIKILKVMSAIAEENGNYPHHLFLKLHEPFVDGFLLDSHLRGGTGEPADWNVCADLVKVSRLPIFLAGGLTPQNVATAMAKVRPFGVDVETGVSDRIPNGPLVKNLMKCRKFVEAVVRADDQIDSSEFENLKFGVKFV